MVDPEHWKRLQKLNPSQVCERSGAEFERAGEFYRLRMLREELEISPKERVVRWAGRRAPSEKPPGFNHQLVSVIYLLTAAGALDGPMLPGPEDDWISPKSLPTGDFFFRGLHEIPTTELLRRFGADLGGFLEAGRRLGAETPKGEGDACLIIRVLPKVSVKYVLWAGSDEFPPSLTVLFQRNIGRYLLLDAMLAMTWIVNNALLSAGAEDIICAREQTRVK